MKADIARYKAMAITPYQWQVTLEVEAVCFVIRWQCVIMQQDTGFTGAYGPLIYRTTARQLQEGSKLKVIDLDRLGSQSVLNPPR